jgi:hypothetical protein
VSRWTPSPWLATFSRRWTCCGSSLIFGPPRGPPPVGNTIARQRYRRSVTPRSEALPDGARRAARPPQHGAKEVAKDRH